MMMHTSQCSQYAVVDGLTVRFMVRPRRTRQKGYREPVLVDTHRFRSHAEAEKAARKWTKPLAH
jgi:hypothetical protein